ncbi:MAG TPA: thioesterase family protein [Pyrinomonadaceae bacterium]|jgi:4-hydroxybenzoyl-CoA thioesterase
MSDEMEEKPSDLLQPAARSPQPFSTRIVVRFGETDPAGLVYYPVLFHYCHVAMEEFFAARAAGSYAQLLARGRIGFPTVRVEAEFFVPLVYGDEVDISVAVARIGRSSTTFRYNLTRASDQTLCARATCVQVAMNLDTRRAVEIPTELRRVFTASAA